MPNEPFPSDRPIQPNDPSDGSPDEHPDFLGLGEMFQGSGDEAALDPALACDPILPKLPGEHSVTSMVELMTQGGDVEGETLEPSGAGQGDDPATGSVDEAGLCSHGGSDSAVGPVPSRSGEEPAQQLSSTRRFTRARVMSTLGLIMIAGAVLQPGILVGVVSPAVHPEPVNPALHGAAEPSLASIDPANLQPPVSLPTVPVGSVHRGYVSPPRQPANPGPSASAGGTAQPSGTVRSTISGLGNTLFSAVIAGFTTSSAAPVLPSVSVIRRIPGSTHSTARAVPRRPHRGARSKRASHGLIAAQATAIGFVMGADLLLARGWPTLGPASLRRPLRSLAPQGLGVEHGESGIEETPSPATVRVSGPAQPPSVARPGRTVTRLAVQAQQARSSDLDPLGAQAFPKVIAVSTRTQARPLRWDFAEIPIHGISARAIMLTPKVGRVRAVLNGGASFEGRLHKVGQGQVWIEDGPLRMSFEWHALASLGRLAESTSSATGLSDRDRFREELPQVRVKVAGGTLQGGLIHQDGQRVTLLTPAGVQISLDCDGVEPLTSAGEGATLGIRPRRD